MTCEYKKWVFNEPDGDLVKKISSGLEVSEIIANILVNRGIKTVSEAKIFLNPDILNLYSPFLLPDIDKAIYRIKKAIAEKEKILIYGDRDVDGITSVAIVKRFLDTLVEDVCFYIPDQEGYGLQKDIIKKYKEEGIQLIITVDCGISAHDEIEYAKELGIDVVVTDHHQPLETLPGHAIAIVNPKVKNATYPFTELSGATVAFKVCQALKYTETEWYNKELVGLDAKITGKNNEQILEVKALRVKNRMVDDEFYGAEKIKDIKSLAKLLKNLFVFIKDRPLIIYDENKGLNILRKELKEILKKELSNSFIDISAIKENYSQFNLEEMFSDTDEICGKSFGIDNTGYNIDVLKVILPMIEIFHKFLEISDFKMKFFIEENIDLITLGLIADLVPLVGENRNIAKYGLEIMGETKKAGLQAIFKKFNIQGAISVKEISWYIAPFLNAAGRMGKGFLGAELLITEDKEKAQDLLGKINILNKQRKELQKDSVEKINALLPQQCDIDKDKILVIYTDGLERGIISIIASRLFREYNRPIIILHVAGEEATGSARSIEAFDLTMAFQECDGLLIRHGGHKRAAGLTISVENIIEFKEKIKKLAHEKINKDSLIPKVEIDSRIDFSYTKIDFIQDLEKLGPYGMGNPPPVFIIEKVPIKNCNIKDHASEHLFLRIGNNKEAVSAVGWGMGLKKELFNAGKFVDFAFKLELNKWNKKEFVRLSLEDIKPSRLEVVLTGS